MKRIFLFILTNVAVLLTLSIVANLLGINRYLHGTGLNIGMLLVFSTFMGFAGSIISLLMSKKMAMWSTGAVIINTPRDEIESWLVKRVTQFAEAAGIATPDVAIYESEDPNAFATGANRNAALVAVSTGLLQNMNRDEVEGVLAHEIAHIANGDMVTMTLMQGVVNTFTIFMARVIGYVVDKVLLKNENGTGLAYYATVMISELVLTLLGSIVVMWFSRVREYRADEGSAELGGAAKMVRALQRLQTITGQHPSELPKSMAAMGINGGSGLMGLFKTHPDLSDRIANIQRKFGG